MTDKEIRVLELTRDAWNAFMELSVQSQDDTQEFRFHVHALQNIILAREGMRVLLEDGPDNQSDKMPKEIKP